MGAGDEMIYRAEPSQESRYISEGGIIAATFLSRIVMVEKCMAPGIRVLLITARSRGIGLLVTAVGPVYTHR